MSLLIKAKENRRVAEKCKVMGKFNSGASRAYYSAFQMAKHLLVKNNFSYHEFLKDHPKYCDGKEQRDYSHHTIYYALRHYLLKKGINKNDLDQLNVWDSLYNKRVKADYHEELVTKQDMDRCLKELTMILEVLERY
jgi:uncharacterized protein (UPF0332 family)